LPYAVVVARFGAFVFYRALPYAVVVARFGAFVFYRALPYAVVVAYFGAFLLVFVVSNFFGGRLQTENLINDFLQFFQ
jgi:hypothetical protein